jgi:hypothetical protein
VRAGLVPLIADLKQRGTKPDDAWLAGDYDTKAQAELCQEVALDMGARGARGGGWGAGFWRSEAKEMGPLSSRCRAHGQAPLLPAPHILRPPGPAPPCRL